MSGFAVVGFEVDAVGEDVDGLLEDGSAMVVVSGCLCDVIWNGMGPEATRSKVKSSQGKASKQQASSSASRREARKSESDVYKGI